MDGHPVKAALVVGQKLVDGPEQGIQASGAVPKGVSGLVFPGRGDQVLGGGGIDRCQAGEGGGNLVDMRIGAVLERQDQAVGIKPFGGQGGNRRKGRAQLGSIRGVPGCIPGKQGSRRRGMITGDARGPDVLRRLPVRSQQRIATGGGVEQ